MHIQSIRFSAVLMTFFLLSTGCGLGTDASSSGQTEQALNRVPAPPSPHALSQDLLLPYGAHNTPRLDGVLSCSNDEDCGKEFYCQKSLGYCAGKGTCEPVETRGMCTMEFAPVCGCDGNTYSNPCVASKQGKNVVHRGECRGEQHCLTYEKSIGVNAQGQNRNLTYAGNFATREEAEETLQQLLDRSVVKSEVVRGNCKVHAEALRCFRIFRPVCASEPIEFQYSNSCILQGALLEKAGESGEQHTLWEERPCQSPEAPVF